MPAESEEIVLDADLGAPPHLAPDLHQPDLHRRSRRHHQARLGRTVLASRDSAAVERAPGAPRSARPGGPPRGPGTAPRASVPGAVRGAVASRTMTSGTIASGRRS